jgi:hypothetical protein
MKWSAAILAAHSDLAAILGRDCSPALHLHEDDIYAT